MKKTTVPVMMITMPTTRERTPVTIRAMSHSSRLGCIQTAGALKRMKIDRYVDIDTVTSIITIPTKSNNECLSLFTGHVGNTYDTSHKKVF